MPEIQHIYIHIPFCSGKCTYCAFFSTLYNNDLAESFLHALDREIAAASRCHHLRARTIYIGGGTPLLLSTPQLKQLLQSVVCHIDVSNLREWTIEGNPGNLDNNKITLLQEYGVTRVSLGAQSMDDAILSIAERRHTASDTCQTAQQLRAAGLDNFGLDLIAGLPGCTPETWQSTLENTIALHPAHISVYALSIEPGSRLYAMRDSHRWRPDDAGAEAVALATASRMLATAGYRQYEISNYARPGFECQHNLAVWRGADYIGFGPAAASRIGLTRRTNSPDLAAYISEPAPPRESETLAPITDATERFMFNFRLFDGVNPRKFAADFGAPASELLDYWLKQLADLRARGLVIEHDGCWALSKRGRDYADAVSAAMLP